MAAKQIRHLLIMKRETIDHELLRPELVRLAFLLHPEDLPDLQGAEQARQYPGALAELGALGLVDGMANAGDALAALGHGPHGAEQAVAAVARVADDARLLALPLALPAPVAAGPPPLPLDRGPRHRDVLLFGGRFWSGRSGREIPAWLGYTMDSLEINYVPLKEKKQEINYVTTHPR